MSKEKRFTLRLNEAEADELERIEEEGGHTTTTAAIRAMIATWRAREEALMRQVAEIRELKDVAWNYRAILEDLASVLTRIERIEKEMAKKS